MYQTVNVHQMWKGKWLSSGTQYEPCYLYKTSNLYQMRMDKNVLDVVEQVVHRWATAMEAIGHI